MNRQNAVTGLLSALLACTGPVILIIHSANEAGLNRIQLISWVSAIYLFGGILNTALAMVHRLPFGGAHSITAAAYLTTVSAKFSFPELAGGFMLAGLIIAVFGWTGLFHNVLNKIPKPILDAMLAGIVTPYIVKMVPSLKADLLVGLFAVCGFFIVPRFIKWISPVLGALLCGSIGLLLHFSFPEMQKPVFTLFHIVKPSFSIQGFLSISIPVAVLILSNDIAVAMAALRKNGYESPTNRALIFSGLGTCFVALFGGHAISVGGMMTALCSSEEAGAKPFRYRAAIVSGVIVACFGLLAWATVMVMEVLPSSFVSLVAGFTLLGVLLNSLQSAFSESSYRYSTVFSFIIALANVSFLQIAAPVWSLLIGWITAMYLKEGPLPEKQNLAAE